MSLRESLWFGRASFACALWLASVAGVGGEYTIVGWNNLGMHCTDGSDFSVFSILPHYNTIQAQLIHQGKLVKSPAGITVTYQAVADPDGSVNKTSKGKGNFYQFVQTLYGVALLPDKGLAGFGMPGPSNVPQAMKFDPKLNWFIAEGIPITPYDDAGRKNYYPLMRVVAKDTAKRVLASTDIVLPVSDEMDCRVCHLTGTQAAARPAAGWVGDKDPARDYKLNILRLHDEREAGNPAYAAALATAGYSPQGLYANVARLGQPILCARCHASEALPGTGVAGVAPLTASIHAYHALVEDPISHRLLEDVSNRASCYRCHPGAETRCLRGAMGNAVAADGTMSMQCQSCHGSMSQVGASTRTGWSDEPNCQNCHTGTAVKNSGAIRFTSVFDAQGKPRQAADLKFATNPNTPLPGTSLYRFSKGHGGLQCEACHGPTHAESPSSHRNDNIQSIQVQGHVGALAECSACHTEVPETVTGGPHGMHPVGAFWLDHHGDAGKSPSQCRVCHGLDYRGTVLSRSLGDRTLRTEFGVKTFWRGSQIGCYSCHQGPFNESANPNQAPVVTSTTLTAPGGTPSSLKLQATDANRNPLTLRIVTQPAHGTVALKGTLATYYPEAGYSGSDEFTFAAWDGSINSNLGRVKLTVTAGAVASLEVIGAETGLALAWPASGGPFVLESAEPEVGRGGWERVGISEVRDGLVTVAFNTAEVLRTYRLRSEPATGPVER